MEGFKFSTIEEAVADLRAGKMIIAVDDPDRENEGDLNMLHLKMSILWLRMPRD